MKKLILALSFSVGILSTSFAQQADTTKYVYMQIRTVPKFTGGGKIEAMFGTSGFYIDQKTQGEITAGLSVFESHIDALTFLSDKGWQFVNTFTLQVQGIGGYNTWVLYVLRKPKRDLPKVPRN